MATQISPCEHGKTYTGRASIVNSALFLEGANSTGADLSVAKSIGLDDEMVYYIMIARPSQSITTVGQLAVTHSIQLRTDLYPTPAANEIAMGTFKSVEPETNRQAKAPVSLRLQ